MRQKWWTQNTWSLLAMLFSSIALSVLLSGRAYSLTFHYLLSSIAGGLMLTACIAREPFFLPALVLSVGVALTWFPELMFPLTLTVIAVLGWRAWKERP